MCTSVKKVKLNFFYLTIFDLKNVTKIKQRVVEILLKFTLWHKYKPNLMIIGLVDFSLNLFNVKKKAIKNGK